MEPGAGGPWGDPRRGYIYGAGSAMQMPHTDAATAGGVLKRSLDELERWQNHRQQQMQQALYMRAVKQRTAAASAAVSPLTSIDVAAVLQGTPSQPLFLSGSGLVGSLASPSSTLSSVTTASRAAMQPHTHQQVPFVPSSAQAHGLAVPRAPAPSTTASELTILQELEKQLFGDDEEEEPAMSGTASAVINSDWEQEIQQLNSIATAPSAAFPAVATSYNINNNAGMTRSPSNSSTSTASSSASCSPPTSVTSSRQILSEAAVAIADGNLETAATRLATVNRAAANPRGDVEQRLVVMMVAALSSRIAPTVSAPSQHLADLFGTEHRIGSRLLHEISPCFRLALHAANSAIVEAFADNRAIHLVDFDINYPQHVALIQCLADRRGPGTSLKVTAVTDPSSPYTHAQAAGRALKKLAQRAGIDYRFELISCRVADIEASRLGCEPGEALAVNLAFALSHVPDESVSPANPRDELLRRVRALGPQVVALVEQELNSNTAPLPNRLSDAFAHYGAILESLDATVGWDSSERARAEEAVARKAANAVGREGPDRLERCEVFGKWRARFGMAGFRPVSLVPGVADLVMAPLGTSPPGLGVKLENGVLRLGWMGRVVAVASAWR